MSALKIRFKKKITNKGGKGDEQAKAEEEAKRRNEEARGWKKNLQNGCTVKRKGKEKLPKKQLRKPKKQPKKRRESSMRSCKSRKQKG